MPQHVTRLVGVVDAAKQLSISRRSLYVLIANGDLASCRIGGRRLIPLPAIEAYIAAQIEATRSTRDGAK